MIINGRWIEKSSMDQEHIWINCYAECDLFPRCQLLSAARMDVNE